MPHGKHAPGTTLVTITMPVSLRNAIDEIVRAEEPVPDRKPNRTAWIVTTLYEAVKAYREQKLQPAKFAGIHVIDAPTGNPSRSSINPSGLNEEPAKATPLKPTGPRARSTRGIKKVVERSRKNP